MLGKLAKWLRILGFDTAYFNKIDDKELLELAGKENRILLTRDTGIIDRAGRSPVVFIKSSKWDEQVRQVLNEFGLREKTSPHTRCLDCNRSLKHLAKDRAENLVTPFIFSRADSFSLCPDCGRVYWRGTHFKDMEKKLNLILDITGDHKRRG